MSFQIYELSVLYSLYAADTPELTKSLLRLVDIHNTLYPVNLKSSTLAFESIPKPRQRSLALSILFWIARPRAREGPDSKGPTDFLPGSPEALRANPLAGPVLYIYESQQLSKQDSSAQSMENDLGFALALWKTFRNGDWTRRERLVQGLSLSSSDSQNNRSYSPELRLMFRNHVSRSMSSARAISVEVMSKAYHSLPIKDVVQSVGLSDREETGPPFEVNLDENAAWLMDLRTKYQLEESVALVNGQLVFKVPKQKNAVSI
ncbi:hypothetical protein BGW38_001795 [Lunasporangiospora selenospora]|uniref:Uncharacterized protein n=1 Tax=Lunasporangiospora selenospora TaxID=979761 RepID=A0A9P6FSY0_9FUNG|nr:hypothetical protein BGW38_001795 [Lunasporangiospora selenospora]